MTHRHGWRVEPGFDDPASRIARQGRQERRVLGAVGKTRRQGCHFGRPSAFNGKVDESKWLSFTVTMRDPTFFELMEQFTGNVAGTGGLVTFTDSTG